MKILLTGGSGDLGQVLAPQLVARGEEPVNLDLAAPKQLVGEFVKGSILDRDLLKSMLPGVGCVVHIAAWHGIHEFRKEKDAFDFWDLNVTGTFNLLESSVRAGCTKFVYISSSSVDDWPGIYAHSKIIGEDLMRTYAARHAMRGVTLRPRAFIPHWNRAVYADVSEWARWYWKGAVHIDDVAQAVLQAIDALSSDSWRECPALNIDGACDFSADELRNWDAEGAGSTFRKRFGEERFSLATRCGLDPASKPKILGFTEAEKAIGYRPKFGFAQMLQELSKAELAKK